jgi:hypothetical protein
LVDDAEEEDVAFKNFSCLVSRPNTSAQFRHVDAHAYERQYAMAITGNGSQHTVSSIVVDPMDTPEDLIKVWTDLVRDCSKLRGLRTSPASDTSTTAASSGMDDTEAGAGSICPDLEDESTLRDVAGSILRAMREVPHVPGWIENYGKVLGRPSRTVDVAGGWEPGTVVSLHGGNVHYGPACPSFRSVLFFTASPRGAPPYDVDTQFTGPTLAGTIAFAVWSRIAEQEHCAEFLRRVLHMTVLEDPCPIDFAPYMSSVIPEDHPVRQAMRLAQVAKEEKVRALSPPLPPPLPLAARSKRKRARDAKESSSTGLEEGATSSSSSSFPTAARVEETMADSDPPTVSPSLPVASNP